MIVVPVKEGENIERALAMEHAVYVQQLHRNED